MTAGSSTTSHRHGWLLPPLGACSAMSMHSSTTSRLTGREKSRRLRTDRVVVSSLSVWARSKPAADVVIGCLLGGSDLYRDAVEHGAAGDGVEQRVVGEQVRV